MNGLVPRRLLLIASVASVAIFCGGASDWPAFRHNAQRTAEQPEASVLSDPEKVKTLHKEWIFRASPPQPFRASPVVYNGLVFIGNSNGYFYALNANDGTLKWRYPPVECRREKCPPLESKFTCNPSSHGIASSATIARIDKIDVVIFAAPDPCVGTGLGEGRLFALDAKTGKEIWKSEVIAHLTGCTDQCTTELHENLGYSSPLVLGNRVYVGVGDHCDNPIQKGRVAAVHLATGHPVQGFEYCSTGTCKDQPRTRGGGVSSPPAGWKNSVFITTGNTRSGSNLEPRPNRGLSLLRLKASNGNVDWQFQPVPWKLDGDADWSAAPTVMSTATCGPVVISTQKDGWTHALDADNGKQLWSFPPHKIPFSCEDGSCHGDSRYMRSGAAWGDVYVTMNGGSNLKMNVREAYNHLHAFNVCEPDNPLRWLIKVPHTSDCSVEDGPTRCLGNPTITGGIVYVGTDQGWLVAIADPAVAPDAGLRCENLDVRTEDCTAMGFQRVREPKLLACVKLVGSMVYNEPALADGKVFVSTQAGLVYMLQPVSGQENPCN